MLLAHVLVCKYSLLLPLNRQSTTYGPEGVVVQLLVAA
jgi:hypothetical protein